MPELSPEERERIYQEEKARIEARQQIEGELRVKEMSTASREAIASSQSPSSLDAEKQKAKEENAKSSQTCGCLFAALVAIVGIIFAIGGPQGPNQGDTTSPGLDYSRTPNAAFSPPPAPAYTPPPITDETKIVVTSQKWTFENYGYDYVRGSVKNKSDRTVSYWKISAEFYDKKGAIIDTAYTNSLETLRPGASKRFEIMLTHPPGGKKFRSFVEEVQFAD